MHQPHTVRIGMVLAILFGSVVTLRAGSPAVVRRSADGLDLPAAAPARTFHANMPIIGAILGVKPEEVGRVFSAHKSAALLARRSPRDLGCDWFALNVDGADVMGLGLSDGRVYKVALYYDVATELKVNNLRKQVDAHSDPMVKTTFTPIAAEKDKKPSLLITFEVDRIEIYIATHALATDMVEALRKREWIASMTDEQAQLIGDGPGKFVATYAPEKQGGDGVGANTIFAEGTAPDVRIVFEAKNLHEAREEALRRHKNLKNVERASGDGAK